MPPQPGFLESTAHTKALGIATFAAATTLALLLTSVSMSRASSFPHPPSRVSMGELPSAIGSSSAAPVELKCVRTWPEVRVRAYGYDHVVHLRNQCTEPASCIVSTDVNPQPTQVALSAGQETEIVTFQSSPASVFLPRVTCVAAR